MGLYNGGLALLSPLYYQFGNNSEFYWHTEAGLDIGVTFDPWSFLMFAASRAVSC